VNSVSGTVNNKYKNSPKSVSTCPKTIWPDRAKIVRAVLNNNGSLQASFMESLRPPNQSARSAKLIDRLTDSLSHEDKKPDEPDKDCT